MLTAGFIRTAHWYSRDRRALATLKPPRTNSPFIGSRSAAARFRLATREKGTLLNESFDAFPLGRSSLPEVRTPSYAYFDRTAFILLLERPYIQRIVRALRPKGFGKSLFLSTLKMFHDCALPEDDFVRLFQDTAVMKAVADGEIRHGQFLILDLDFSAVDYSQDIEKTRKYESHLGVPTVPDISATDCLSSLSGLIGQVARKWSRENPFALFIVIDEYDAISNEFLNPPEHDKLRSYRMSLLQALYASFKSYHHDKQIARMFITGVTPLSMGGYASSGFNIYEDITSDLRFAGMFGLTESDVRQALQGILGNEKVQEELEHMTTMFSGYRFSNESEITVFNTTSVMEYLQARKTQRPVPASPERSELSKSFVELLANLDAGRELLQNALLNRSICAYLINTSYYLGDVLGERTEGRYVKSLLMHHGGLTFKPPLRSGELCLPNTIARRRVAEVMLSYHGVRDTRSLTAAQNQFLFHDDIAPFLQLVTFALAPTHRDDEQLNQLTVLICLLLSLRPPNYDHAEYDVKVGWNRITRNQCVGYLDVLVQRPKARMCVLELNIVRAADLDPSTLPASVLPTDRRPRPTEIAAALATLNDDQFAQVRFWNDCSHERYAGKTIGEIVQQSASEQLLSYATSRKSISKSEYNQSAIVGYSVTFVAGSRYLCQQHVF